MTVAADPRWASLRALIGRLASADQPDTFIADCVAALVTTLGASRGLVFLTDAAGATTTIHAAGKGRLLTASEQAEISRSVVRETWRRRAPVLWEPIDPSSGSMAVLGIVAALAAPLRPLLAGDDAAPRGVLYLDFRDAIAAAGAPELELVELSASLLAVVLDRDERLAQVSEDLRVQRRGDRGRISPPTLDELLRFPSLASLRGEVATAVASELPVLMLGESGTGKTLLARAIAEASRRTPLVRAMLGAADDLNTITSELFGHEKGSFSGAIAQRVGLVGFADGGSLILDEVLNLPMQAQQLLLDFSQFGTYRPLGHAAAEPLHSRVRLLAATNGDLDRAVTEQKFREDLYHRLAGIVLTLPPLRERRDEICELAEGFLRRLDPDRDWTLTVAARRRLMAPDLRWPGNLRQLELAMQRARDRALANDGEDVIEIDVRHLEGRDLAASRPAARSDDPAGGWAELELERERRDDRERHLLRRVLDKHKGVAARAAAELGIGRTSLVSRMRTLKINETS